jgi:cyclopropane-fatty-acyl-phospholipid synthase
VIVSAEQAASASARIHKAGLADRCQVRLADYRDVDDGPYDAITSIGMYEHVGGTQLAGYAAAIAALLRPGGAFLNHGIARLSPGPDHDRTFIRRFVFPDGDLHPVSDILHALDRAGLEIRDVESLREHYPPTLRQWASNLEGASAQVVSLVGAERERIWRLYLPACALAFERGELSVFQVLTIRPGARHRLPLTRAAVNTRARRSAGRRAVAAHAPRPRIQTSNARNASADPD